jgi:hypothetical protein
MGLKAESQNFKQRMEIKQQRTRFDYTLGISSCTDFEDREGFLVFHKSNVDYQPFLISNPNAANDYTGCRPT